MGSPATHTLTVEISERTFEKIQALARRRQKPADWVVGEILDLSLSSGVPNQEAEWRKVVHAHQGDSPAALRELLRTSLTASEQARMEKLLESNRSGGLTDEESVELDRLQDRMMDVASERAAAIYLLQRHSAAPESTV
jgi:hypothetical protein